MRFTQDGWQRVRDQVGRGKLRGVVRVNQRYAIYVHERTELRHPVGGAKFLTRALYGNVGPTLQAIADQVFEAGPRQGMIDGMEGLAGATSRNTPVEFNNLRRSMNPKVYDNGALVYNRPPEQPRLSYAQLKALRRGRRRRR